MVQSQCFHCIHEEVCNYHSEYKRAIEAVGNVSYNKNNGEGAEVVIKSPIIFKAICPHFYKRGVNSRGGAAE